MLAVYGGMLVVQDYSPLGGEDGVTLPIINLHMGYFKKAPVGVDACARITAEIVRSVGARNYCRT